MFTGSNRQLEDFRALPVMAISAGARFHKPTAEQIAKIADSMKKDGQQNPVVVRKTGHNEFEIVSGATRHKAAVKLGWTYIEAKIMHAEHVLDYKIAELVENESRTDLTREQHATSRARLKELREERDKVLDKELMKIASEPKAKGGRGKKGGLREAARKADVPKSTAHRRQMKTVPKSEVGQFSQKASANAAAIEAGWRSKLTPYEQAARIIECKLSEEEQRQLWQLLDTRLNSPLKKRGAA